MARANSNTGSTTLAEQAVFFAGSTITGDAVVAIEGWDINAQERVTGIDRWSAGFRAGGTAGLSTFGPIAAGRAMAGQTINTGSRVGSTIRCTRPPNRVPKRISFPRTADEMDDFLGIPGAKKPDGPTTPGRNKTVWQPNADTKITFERHPYHLGAPDWHRDYHWHLDTPGRLHQRFLPGEDIPGLGGRGN